MGVSVPSTTGPMADGEERVRLEPGRLGEFHARLLRAAYAMCGSRHDAEDLAQEAYERVLRRPRFVRRDRDLAYLLRVLRSVWSAQVETMTRRRTAPTAPEDLEWLVDERAGLEVS